MSISGLKKVGIIGGVGWPSTVEYYRSICEASQQHFATLLAEAPYPTPEMSIESLNMHQTLRLRGEPGTDRDWEAFDTVFRIALLRLQDAGCDFAMIASVTPHMRLASIREGVDIPVVNILEEAAKAVAGTGAKNALILGTSITMTSSGFDDELLHYGISVNDPLPMHQIDVLQTLINDKFYQGKGADAREELLEFIGPHVPNREETTIVLGCTELALAFPDCEGKAVFQSDGYNFVNPGQAHIAAAVSAALGSRSPAE